MLAFLTAGNSGGQPLQGSQYMAPLAFFASFRRFARLEILFNYSSLRCSALITTRTPDRTCPKIVPEPFTHWNFVAMVGKGQVVVAVCLTISFVVFCLRFYLRVIKNGQFTFLEITLLFALAMEVAFAGIQIKKYQLMAAPSTVTNAVELRKAITFFYIACIWSVKVTFSLLHIRVTEGISAVHVWAGRTLYLLAFSWILVYVTYLLKCLPVSRNWDAPLGHVKPCPSILHTWDFWLHLALHISTDIWLCILPFPALVKISERRIRTAVCGVYSLAGITIIISILRAVILGLNTGASLEHISILTMIEVTTIVVMGCLPGLSSTFTRKYIHHGISNPESGSAVGQRQSHSSYRNFAQLREPDIELLGVGSETSGERL
ncbi:hypothetical protein B0J14DRAFT_183719 [Halenospora varia]|nr:hypothetical protein B0J14DRAFT_183719 [Halenospora varia]